MREIKRVLRALVAVAASVCIGSGLVASAASASWDLTGGTYSGAGTTASSFEFDNGTFIVRCTVSLSGNSDNVPASTAATDFTPSFPNCNFFGFPAIVTSDPWQLTVVSGASGTYTGQIALTAGRTVVVDIPVIGCTATLTTPRTFVHNGVDLVNLLTYSGGADLDMTLRYGMVTSTAGCPWTSPLMDYRSNGPIMIAGLGVTP